MTNNKNKYFRLYPNYIPVKGVNKSIIADINGSTYFEIPSLVYDVLNITLEKEYELDQLFKHFENKYDAGIKGYLDLFIEKRMGFYSSTNVNFHKYTYEYRSPFKITNAIIEITNEDNYNLFTLIEDLQDLGCYEIELRVKNYASLNFVIEILKKFKTSVIRSFYLICNHKDGQEIYKLEDEIESNLKIIQVKIFNCKNNSKKKKNSKIQHIDQDFIDDDGFSGFIINPTYFYEAQTHNASLNQKVSIDEYGNIKNYLGHKKDFGNVNSVRIKDVIEDDDYTKNWKIPNEKIEKCRECQYRFFCLNFSEVYEKDKKIFKNKYCEDIYLK